jgi:glycosyltransferase involved in cell wall biosynthesis
MYSVLSLNQKYKVVGGSDRYFFNMNELLKENNHEVFEFASMDSTCLPHRDSMYFPSSIDYTKISLSGLVRYLYNHEAKKSLSLYLDYIGGVDIAHLQIYYGQLTSSILSVLKEKNIPIVQTLHEYKLSCPVYTHVNKDEICNKCISGGSINCVLNKCKSNSYISSVVRFAEYNISRFLGDVKYIDKFICVSNFQKSKMLEAGIPEQKLEVLYNFVPINDGSSHVINGNYLLFFGRLEKLKGIHTLIEAMMYHPDKKLIIAGEGPYEEALKRLVDLNNLSERVEFHGFVTGSKLWELVHNSKAVMVPSEWYENCSMTVLEGKSFSKPIIASSIGGITEQIHDGIDGFLHKPGCANSISEAIVKLYSSEYFSLCNSSRMDLEDRYSSKVHYPKLVDIYRSVLKNKMVDIDVE